MVTRSLWLHEREQPEWLFAQVVKHGFNRCDDAQPYERVLLAALLAECERRHVAVQLPGLTLWKRWPGQPTLHITPHAVIAQHPVTFRIVGHPGKALAVELSADTLAAEIVASRRALLELRHIPVCFPVAEIKAAATERASDIIELALDTEA